ncbi:MAG: hypothetical protein HOF75_06820 [Flavobacteriaceae bacterium]|jgi:hypothetical protein|nr:hypothetical protein [Flavobacteriaceae bacterium]MBT3919148.1 hypothetical protein [Flavobacteriaceae bacterium]MBT6705135.1 hypothetical protein [Flavobacteriaceae bacterium]|tara:strand:- start:788 stop:1447 length:660 start_codon:yes stop_codon:yes gene_type:complete
MKFKLLFILFLLINCEAILFAQFENSNNSVQFEVVEDDFKTPDGMELPAIKLPSIIKSKNPLRMNDYSGLGLEESELLDITHKDNFLDLKTNEAPKYFTKDKKIAEEFGRDQYLGELRTGSLNVTIMYRDHEYVDGDRVRIYVNGDIVKSSVYLSAGFNGFTFLLQPGFNKVEFQALNQGSSGPNTAELRIFNDEGDVISANQWNLTTGRKAMVTIIKE